MPEIGRFLQPDTIVPDPMDPQSLNRYSYVLNNPLRYTDPTGRCPSGFGWACDIGTTVADCGRDPFGCGQSLLSRGSGWGWTGIRWSMLAWGYANEARSWASAIASPAGPSELASKILDLPPVEAACRSAGPTCKVLEGLSDPIGSLAEAIPSGDVAGVPVGDIAATTIACGPALSASTCVGVARDRCDWECASNAIQIADLAPIGSVPIGGQAIGLVVDVAAFVAAEIDILRSDCRDNPGVHVTNLTNLGLGIAGNLASTAPNVLTSSAEAGFYVGTAGGC